MHTCEQDTRLQQLAGLPDFFSVTELVRVFPISRAIAYRLSAQGQIPCLRVGKRVIFSRDRLKDWVEQVLWECEQT